MKFSKKIIVSSLLGIIIFSNMNIENMNTFVDAKEIYNNSEREQNGDLNLRNVLNDEKLVGIKKIIIDSDGNPSSFKNINMKQKNLSLPDGNYTLDYGDGWVKGLDAGVIGSLIVPNGDQGTFFRNHTGRFSNKISFQTSLSFNAKFVTATIKAGYGHKWVENTTMKIDKTIQAPSNKNLFVKVQDVFRRVDVIKVRNGKIIDRAESYKPTSYTFKSLEFNDGEKVNQSKIYERVTHNILGDSGYDINGVIDTDAKYEDKVVNFLDKQEDFWNTKTYDLKDAVGIYFTVPKDGKYQIKELIRPDKYSNELDIQRTYYGTQKKLYKVDSVYNGKVNLIGSTNYNIGFVQTPIHFGDFPGDNLISDLKANETYLLMLNSDRDQNIPYYNKFSYRVRLKRL